MFNLTKLFYLFWISVAFSPQTCVLWSLSEPKVNSFDIDFAKSYSYDMGKVKTSLSNVGESSQSLNFAFTKLRFFFLYAERRGPVLLL